MSVLSGRRLRFILAKYGVIGSLRLVIQRACRRLFQNAHYVFVLPEISASCAKFELPAWLHVATYAQLSEVPTGFLETLAIRKGGDVYARRLLERFFDRGAVLWVASVNGEFAGYHWAARQGLDGFFFYPLTQSEAIICAAEVFEEHRGRRIWPLLIQRTCQELAEQGVSNVCIDCKIWNHSSRRGIETAGLSMLGIASRRRIFGRNIVLWKPQPQKRIEQSELRVTRKTSARSEGSH